MTIKCNKCNTSHDSIHDAIRCCQEIYEIEGWKCCECGEIYNSDTEAYFCCADIDTDAMEVKNGN